MKIFFLEMKFIFMKVLNLYCKFGPTNEYFHEFLNLKYSPNNIDVKTLRFLYTYENKVECIKKGVGSRGKKKARRIAGYHHRSQMTLGSTTCTRKRT